MLNGAKNKKAVWSGVATLIVTVLALGIAPTAHAANPVAEVIKLAGNIIGGATTLLPSIALGVVLYFLGVIGSTLVWVAGWVISFGVELNTNILSANNAALRVGWSISRDLANLGFVLAIIFIAFLTILRSAGYDTKQMLTRLIIAALLVNFSLVIAGAFIDFAGVISGFFLSKISDSGGIGLSSQITAGFAPQAFLQTDTSVLDKVKAGFSALTFPGQMGFLAGLGFATFLTFIVALTLLTLAAMFLARFVILTLLLAVAPLAWLLWIWPGLEQHWKTWWSEFMRWVFFMPSATFFLYLALTIALKRGEYIGALADAVKAGAAPEHVTIVANLPSQFGQAAAVIGLAIGGLILSYKVGGFASAAASMTGGWVAKKGQEFGKRRGIQLGTAPLRMQALRDRMNAWSKGENLKGEKLSGAGLAIRSTLARPIQWAQQQGGGVVEEYKQGLKGRSPAQVALRYASASGAERAAIIDQLASSSDLDKLPSVDMDLYKRYGFDPKNVTKRNPLLNDKVLEAIQKRDFAAFDKEMATVLGSMESSKWGEAQWDDVLSKGINTGVSADEWKAAFRPRVINTMVRKGSSTMKNEFSQVMRKHKPAEQRELKAEIEKLGEANINTQVYDYLQHNLGQDLISGVISGGAAGGKAAAAGAGEAKEKKPLLFDASGRPVT